MDQEDVPQIVGLKVKFVGDVAIGEPLDAATYLIANLIARPSEADSYREVTYIGVANRPDPDETVRYLSFYSYFLLHELIRDVGSQGEGRAWMAEICLRTIENLNVKQFAKDMVGSMFSTIRDNNDVVGDGCDWCVSLGDDPLKNVRKAIVMIEVAALTVAYSLPEPSWRPVGERVVTIAEYSRPGLTE